MRTSLHGSRAVDARHTPRHTLPFAHVVARACLAAGVLLWTFTALTSASSISFAVPPRATSPDVTAVDGASLQLSTAVFALSTPTSPGGTPGPTPTPAPPE